MKFLLDPKRTIPTRMSCYSTGQGGRQCDEDHEELGWRHAESWGEVAEWLAAGAEVRDEDGDLIQEIAVVAPKNKNADSGAAVRLFSGGRYTYTAYQILLEDVSLIPAATPEEEADAMASIMEAFRSNRLS